MDNSAKMSIALVAIFALFWVAVGWSGEKQDWNIAEPFSEKFLSAPPNIAAQPIQSKFEGHMVYRSADYTAEVLADFEASGLVLSKRRYGSDITSDISPVDFALAWGELATHPRVSEMKVRQGGRFYSYWYGKDQPFSSPKMISLNSSNMHMIPANDEVRARLMKVRKGDLVRFSGHLVEVRSKDMRPWRSSLTRTDTGSGACEIILVKDIQIYRN